MKSLQTAQVIYNLNQTFLKMLMAKILKRKQKYCCYKYYKYKYVINIKYITGGKLKLKLTWGFC